MSKKHMSKKNKRSSLEVIVNNNQASQNGAGKKTFHKKDIKYVTPITDTQKAVMDAYKNDMNMFLHGSAGCGKTFLGMYLALQDVLDSETEFDKLIIIRSAVATRDIGFLPGTEEEKMAIYEMPYDAICNELIKYGKSYENMKKLGYIEFMSSSFLRGLTFDHAIVLVDEVQNMCASELHTIMTRIGYNSKIIFSGDLAQADLIKTNRDKSGMGDFMNIIGSLDDFASVKFTSDDIVRSDLVKRYIIAKEKYENN